MVRFFMVAVIVLAASHAAAEPERGRTLAAMNDYFDGEKRGGITLVGMGAAGLLAGGLMLRSAPPHARGRVVSAARRRRPARRGRHLRLRRVWQRAKLDQRLRDQHFYARSLIESNSDAMMTTDPRGIITDVNKQTEALTGCTRDELIGALFKNYFTDRATHAAALRGLSAHLTSLETSGRVWAPTIP